ncbi:MAG: heme-binding protein [Erysipelotrichaceae bacterium]|nr:heme-binding protein [Erysipelotrichaceae bacterium]
METKHSSLYVYEHRDEFHLDDSYAICGGGYPLIVNGELKGAFIVSGLRYDEDHQLIVDVLKEMEAER